MENVIFPVRWGASPWNEYKNRTVYSEQLVRLGATQMCSTSDDLVRVLRDGGYALIDAKAQALFEGTGFFIEDCERWFTPVITTFKKRLAPRNRLQEIARGLEAHFCMPEFAPQVCRQFIDLPKNARILVGMEPLPPFGEENYVDRYFEIKTDICGGVMLTATTGDAGLNEVFTHLLLCQ